MSCLGDGHQSTPRGTPGPYTGRGGGSGKFPMVRAFAVLFVALSGMARHNSQPLGNRSGSGCD